MDVLCSIHQRGLSGNTIGGARYWLRPEVAGIIKRHHLALPGASGHANMNPPGCGT
jgi:hypothetical protein